LKSLPYKNPISKGESPSAKNMAQVEKGLPSLEVAQVEEAFR